ncbi:hypothetical protein GCM10028773_47560 [Spirosoma koreense]
MAIGGEVNNTPIRPTKIPSRTCLTSKSAVGSDTDSLAYQICLGIVDGVALNGDSIDVFFDAFAQ